MSIAGRDPEEYVRKVTFEFPFAAFLTEFSFDWFTAAPSCPEAGNRRVVSTHGTDAVLAAVHRDSPAIGLVCPVPEGTVAQTEGALHPCTDSISSAASTTYIHTIPAHAYQSYGVYEDDLGHACLVIAVEKRVFGCHSDLRCEDTRVAGTSADATALAGKVPASEEPSVQFLLYTRDLSPIEKCLSPESAIGKWCLLDQGEGNFLETAMHPDGKCMSVHTIRPFHCAADVPYSAIVQCTAPEQLNTSRFHWLAEHFLEERAEGGEGGGGSAPRLIVGKARHPVLAAVHHDQPTLVIGWPQEDKHGDAVVDKQGNSLIDTYAFPASAYDSGGIWYDDAVEVCIVVRLKFGALSNEGNDSATDETSVVYLYEKNRVVVPGSIQEWGEWSLADAGKGVGLMADKHINRRCKEVPVVPRTLEWTKQRVWS